MKKNRICFKCANIYESETYKELICPHCGYQITSRRYDLIMNDAEDGVEFGYNYRLRYEIDYNRSKKIEKHYYLIPLDETLKFIGVAIASGVIGNVSHDLVKKAINSIKKKINNKKYSEGEYLPLINDQEKMDIFIKYVEAFYNDFESLKPEIKEAIYEEMIVHKSMEGMNDIIKSMHPQLMVEVKKCDFKFSQEQMFKSMLEVKTELQKKKKIKSYFYDGFWDSLEE